MQCKWEGPSSIASGKVTRSQVQPDAGFPPPEVFILPLVEIYRLDRITVLFFIIMLLLFGFDSGQDVWLAARQDTAQPMGARDRRRLHDCYIRSSAHLAGESGFVASSDHMSRSLAAAIETPS